MRTSIVKASMALGAMCLFGTSLHAQTYGANATIPFSFQAAGRVLPAGNYRVDSATSKPLRISNRKTGRSIFILAGMTEETRKHSPTLVFHRCGSEYFLAEVWTPYGLGSKVPTTKREKELMLAPKPVETAVVAIALRAD